MPEMTSYERDFELRFLKGRGTAFQDFFSELMECAHPSDFQRIRPHGNWGDLKCDGYLRSGRTVFQVYAPETMRNVKRLLMKVSADFEGARAHWGDRMNRWVFVHNMRDGLPAPAVQFLQDLGEQLNAPDVDVWGYIELWRLFERLNPDDRRALFPPIAYHVSAPPSPCLPKPSETEAYWAWLASAPLEQPINGPLVALRNLNLPIRIVTPEDVRAQRSRDAHAIERYARNTTSWRIAPDDGSFVEHRESQYSRETWDISRVLRHNRHVLIVGDAGSGKSTLLHRFAVQEGRRLAALTWERACRQTPIFVELWRFSPDRSILDLIFDSVAHSEVSIRRDELLQAINHGYVVLLLDGLDEVPDSSRRECLAQIVAIIDRYPRSRLVLTSRQFPKPPEHFRCFHIGALRDADIAAALLAHFGSTRQFRDRFHDLSPDDFVRLELRPEVRQLFRTPLTFGLVLTLLENESTLPKTLFQMYDRFLSWLLDWDVRRDYLPSVTAAIISAEAAAYAMVSTDRVHLAATDWVRAAGNALSISRNDGVVQYATADDVIRVFLSNGLLVNQGGHVSFAHRSFGEFLAARHILNSETPPHIDPISIKTEVARFLCSALPDVSLLLEEIYRNCTDVITMMPFLKEACLANSYDNRFQELYDAIVESQNMAITLTHFLRGPEENAFTDRIDDLVDICLDFRPKALSVLKEAADGIVRGLPWPSSRNWFERIVAGLEEYDWPGAMLHRRLVQIGAFESMDVFCSDGSDPDEDDRVEELFKYLEAVYNDDFVKASQHVEQIAQFLLEQNRYRVSEPKDTV